MTRCLAVVASTMVVLSCTKLREPVQIVIWHTELDPQAQAHIDSLAKQVETEFSASDKRFTPVVTVSALAWGDLATRIFQQLDNPPDLTHLEPFMVYQLFRIYQEPGGFTLEPLDSLIDELERVNGPINPAVRDLHSYALPGQNTHHWGLAYAMGTTSIAYRDAWRPRGLNDPQTWPQLISFADALAKQRSAAPFILPGKDPFFIDQLVNEIVVSLGGSLYMSGRPRIQPNPELDSALYYLQDMIARTNGAYSNTTYRQQFDLFARGKGAVVPVTYGRASKQIDAVIAGAPNISQERMGFRLLKQPGRATSDLGVATIDAEPWVMIGRPERDPQREFRVKVTRRFLELFYARDSYLGFCGLVPAHLRPIFPSMDSAYDALAPQVNWKHWIAVEETMLRMPKGPAPILMDPSRQNSAQPAFALSLQRNAVLSDMVLEAASSNVIELIKHRLDGKPDETERRVRLAAISAAMRRAASRADELYQQATQQ